MFLPRKSNEMPLSTAVATVCQFTCETVLIRLLINSRTWLFVEGELWGDGRLMQLDLLQTVVVRGDSNNVTVTKMIPRCLIWRSALLGKRKWL